MPLSAETTPPVMGNVPRHFYVALASVIRNSRGEINPTHAPRHREFTLREVAVGVRSFLALGGMAGGGIQKVLLWQTAFMLGVGVTTWISM
jgi:hypothetical protein